MKKLLFITGSIIILAVIIYGYHEYTRAPMSAKDSPADFVLDASTLANEYKMDEKAATKKYSGRVLQVKGVLTSFDSYNNINTIVLKANDMSVRCVLDKMNNDVSIPAKGSTLIIKGYCTGYNADELLGSDIMMNNGIIIQ